MNPFVNATLAMTVAELAQLPRERGGEVAFAGRSNAGKSSVINALTNRRRLAFVARHPGKTRTIQFYRVAPERFLVDLPGYGYARTSAQVRARWEPLLEGYLARRRSLVGLVLVMDIRHPLTPLDRRLLAWFSPRRLPLYVLLNKADKVSRSAAIATQRQVAQCLAESALHCGIQAFSCLRRDGVEDVTAILGGWLACGEFGFTQGQNKTPG